MPKTPSKMNMYDMVKIDTIVFEIVGAGLWIVSCLKYPGSDRVNLVSMTYSCIASWRLNKGSSTADEQPPYDYNFEISKII